ncbi:MAG: hypothetical protein HGGPFJEG_02461 [Ignavibacteria bacterium]|nr:hypothetical protein [Ignavibacteria bacterium]
MTDTEIKIRGYNILIKEMGEVNAEKFISLIIREPFDYTEWRKGLFKDKSVKELSSEAMNFRKK